MKCWYLLLIIFPCIERDEEWWRPLGRESANLVEEYGIELLDRKACPAYTTTKPAPMLRLHLLNHRLLVVDISNYEKISEQQLFDCLSVLIEDAHKRLGIKRTETEKCAIIAGKVVDWLTYDGGWGCNLYFDGEFYYLHPCWWEQYKETFLLT